MTCVKIPYPTERAAVDAAEVGDKIYFCFEHDAFHVNSKRGSRLKKHALPQRTVNKMREGK